MSYNPHYYDDRRRSSSPRRRPSPPHDVRHGREGDMTARGQADNRSSSYGSGGEYTRGEYRPNRRPHQDYRRRYQDERDERDYYDDGYHDSDRHDARQPHDQQREYRNRDDEGYRPSRHDQNRSSRYDQDRSLRYERSRSPRRHDGRRQEHGRDWLCQVCGNNNPRGLRHCASCQASENAHAPSKAHPKSERDVQYARHGAEDVGGENEPTQFLIFRNLEANVTEELLAKGAAKLLKSDEERQTAPGKMQSTSVVAHAGANPDSIKRVFLVRDRLTGATWRYGLVEFGTVQDAQAARLKYNSMTGQKKFTIASKPVQVDNAHGGVFVPVLADQSPDQDTMSFVSWTNPSLRLAYRSEYAYAQELRVSEEEEHKAGANKEETANTQQDEPKPKPKKAKATNTGETAPQKVMQLPASLQTWTARQKELHGDRPAELKGPSAAANNTSTSTITSQTAVTNQVRFQQSFAYIGKEGNCCLLCRSTFPDEGTLNRHERLDRKHRMKLASAELVAKGKKALKKRGVDPDGQGVTNMQQQQQQEAPSEYRDRAKERRITFQSIKQLGGQQRNAQTPAKNNVMQQFLDEPSSPPREAPSKAARMLAKQGWTAGQGLGSQGSGTTEAIAPSLYAEGVGLGAMGSRLGDAADEAALRTRGNAGEQAARHKQKAAERFRQLE